MLKTFEVFHFYALSKVLERCVYRHMFIIFRPSLYHLQDGFVKGRSTVISLLKTTHCFAEALDNRQQIDAMYLDFSKAFDSHSKSHFLTKKKFLDSRNFVLKIRKVFLNKKKNPKIRKCFCGKKLFLTIRKYKKTFLM